MRIWHSPVYQTHRRQHLWFAHAECVVAGLAFGLWQESVAAGVAFGLFLYTLERGLGNIYWIAYETSKDFVSWGSHIEILLNAIVPPDKKQEMERSWIDRLTGLKA